MYSGVGSGSINDSVVFFSVSLQTLAWFSSQLVFLIIFLYIVKGSGEEFEDADSDGAIAPDEKYHHSGLTASDHACIKKKYDNMVGLEKWKLVSGKVVEDALYNFGLRCRHEQ